MDDQYHAQPDTTVLGTKHNVKVGSRCANTKLSFFCLSMRMFKQPGRCVSVAVLFFALFASFASHRATAMSQIKQVQHLFKRNLLSRSLKVKLQNMAPASMRHRFHIWLRWVWTWFSVIFLLQKDSLCTLCEWCDKSLSVSAISSHQGSFGFLF